MANILEDGIRTLARNGFADIFVPFILIFAICYAVLEKTKIFGRVKKAEKKDGKWEYDYDGSPSTRVNIVISLAIALAAVFMHVLQPGSVFDVVPLINNFLPWIGFILILFLAAHLLFALFAGRAFVPHSDFWFAGIALIVLYVFIASAPAINAPYWLRGVFLGGAFMNTLIALLVFVGVIWFVTGGFGKKGGDAPDGG